VKRRKDIKNTTAMRMLGKITLANWIAGSTSGHDGFSFILCFLLLYGNSFFFFPSITSAKIFKCMSCDNHSWEKPQFPVISCRKIWELKLWNLVFFLTLSKNVVLRLVFLSSIKELNDGNNIFTVI
jgi:hypothetical protein